MYFRAAFVAALVFAVVLAVPAVGSGKTGGYLTGPNQGKPLDVALDYIHRNKQQLGLTASDLGDVVVTRMYTDAHNGVTHIYLQQRYKGIEVDLGQINVNVARDGSVISLGNRFVSKLASAVNRAAPDKAARAGVASAAKALGLSLKQELKVVSAKGGAAREAVFGGAGISLDPIPAKLVYVPRGNGTVRLAWNVSIYETDAQHYWNANVDAVSGDLLSKADYVDRESYQVFAIPKGSPSDGGRTLEVNPASAVASPFGWHDTNGAAGAEFTVTRGNNVHAYTDVDANGAPDPGSDPDGGASLVFDFGLDLTQQPSSYRPAAVTNLFYWNNVMHDVTYAYGFDEASGNFQVDNYGNGGLGGDDVRAEAQDGGGTNNATFLTPADGQRPRMQMFLWTNPSPLRNLVTVDPPSPIAGDYTATNAQWGPQLGLTGISGAVQLVDDGSTDPVPPSTGGATTDGCQPPIGFSAGNIALVDRGGCTFALKVQNAQAAGAVGVIVANNVAGDPITMGGTCGNCSIPVVMVSQTDGTLFKSNMPLVAKLRANPALIDRDASLDAEVISHEYGHGVSNRLVGGAVGCLTGEERMGEGWSDWFALTLTAKAGDTATQPRGMSTYLVFQPPNGVGIRPTQYTTNLGVNPTTYGDIDDLSIIQGVHGVGYAWNSMLWEVYWNLVGVYGFNPNIYGNWTTGGNNLAMQLVMDGMKFTPCNPGFVDSRDAILEADQVLTGGHNQCAIWRGFAKRGLGEDADQGSSDSAFDGTENFDVPNGVCYAFSGLLGSVKATPTLNKTNAGSSVSVVFSLGGDRGLHVFAKDYPKSQQINCTTKAPMGATESTVTAGGASITYNAATDRYTYPWKTQNAWKGTCRQLLAKLGDSTPEERILAYFDFK